jgi:hypothetical protein
MTTIPVNIKALPGVKVQVDNSKDPTLNKKKYYEVGTIFYVEASFDKTGKVSVVYNILLDRRSAKLKRGMFINLSEEYFTVIQPEIEPI